jgi:hypothetical protein
MQVLPLPCMPLQLMSRVSELSGLQCQCLVSHIVGCKRWMLGYLGYLGLQLANRNDGKGRAGSARAASVEDISEQQIGKAHLQQAPRKELITQQTAAAGSHMQSVVFEEFLPSFFNPDGLQKGWEMTSTLLWLQVTMNNIDAIILEPSSRAHLQAMVHDSPDILCLIEACFKMRLSPFHASMHGAVDLRAASPAPAPPGALPFTTMPVRARVRRLLQRYGGVNRFF